MHTMHTTHTTHKTPANRSGIRRRTAWLALTLTTAVLGLGAGCGSSGSGGQPFGTSNVFVADMSNHRIVRMGASGFASLPATTGSSPVTPGSGVGQFAFPQGIFVSSVAANPGVFVADTFNHRIVQMSDISGAGWTTLGGPAHGSGNGQFYNPTAVFVAADGKIYVVDQTNHRITRMDNIAGAGFAAIGTTGTPGSAQGQFRFPRGIFVDASNAAAPVVYVTDAANNRLVRIVTDASFNVVDWKTLPASGTAPGSGQGQFDGPTYVFVDSAGKIYVTDQGNSRLVRMDDITGAGWTTLGTFGSGNGQFNNPRGVFVDGSGHIFVADANDTNNTNNRVVRFNDITGAGWTAFGSTGSGTNQLYQPQSLAVTP